MSPFIFKDLTRPWRNAAAAPFSSTTRQMQRPMTCPAPLRDRGCKVRVWQRTGRDLGLKLGLSEKANVVVIVDA